MPAKSYPPEFIARARAVLAACSGSLKPAAEELGVSRSTLRAWRDGNLPRGVDPDVAIAHQAGTVVAAEYREIESLYKGRLKDPGVVADTKAKDAAIIVGIISDKAVRAEGGSVEGVRSLRIELVAGGISAGTRPTDHGQAQLLWVQAQGFCGLAYRQIGAGIPH